MFSKRSAFEGLLFPGCPFLESMNSVRMTTSARKFCRGPSIQLSNIYILSPSRITLPFSVAFPSLICFPAKYSCREKAIQNQQVPSRHRQRVVEPCGFPLHSSHGVRPYTRLSHSKAYIALPALCCCHRGSLTCPCAKLARNPQK